MQEEDLQTFIRGATRYFQQVASEEPVIDPPFLKGEDSVVLDYTGVIGVSGRERGAVYFTAKSEMLEDLLRALGEKETDADAVADIAGEVANTISGNARKDFGGDFLISVPIVLRGKPDAISFPRNTRTFVIPVIWRGHKAYLIICFE